MLRAVLPSVLALATACGRIGFAPGGLTADADSDAGGDAPADARIGSGPFAPPVPITELNSATLDGDPSVSADGLEIIFSSQRAGSRDLWTSRRATITDPWSAPVLITELNTAMSDDAPALSVDGLILFFSSTRTPNLGGPDIWMTTRPTPSGPWNPPVHVPELSSGSSDFVCSLTGDNLTLWFDSDRGTSLDNYTATRSTVGGPWSVPVNVTSINTAGSESASSISPDNRTLVFSSSRAGGRGGDDLWIATRATAADAFGTAMNLAEVSSPVEDTDPWISPDLTVLYFSSARGANGGDLYVTSR